MELRVARIRDAQDEPGLRVLVDRLWPRGLSKEAAALDEWAKELAPSNDLRSWYHDDKESRQEDFRRRYRRELDEADHDELLDQLRAGAGRHNGLVLLLTDAKDVEGSHVPVVRQWLGKHL